ncbi:MAG: hypothetical protein MMC33_006428 [Icmadophila ericetorum]|nr:hypothetical protein [Icmadophila ericetorum]
MCIVTRLVLRHDHHIQYLVHECAPNATCKNPEGYIINQETKVEVRPTRKACQNCIACAIRPKLAEVKELRAEASRRFQWLGWVGNYGKLLISEQENFWLAKKEYSQLLDWQKEIPKKIARVDSAIEKLTLRAIGEKVKQTNSGLPHGLSWVIDGGSREVEVKDTHSASTGTTFCRQLQLVNHPFSNTASSQTRLASRQTFPCRLSLTQ